mgnify:CR=1 FL=1
MKNLSYYWELNLKTNNINREKLENYFLSSYTSINSFDIENDNKKIKPTNFYTKIIFYTKPNKNNIVEFLSKNLVNFNKIKLEKKVIKIDYKNKFTLPTIKLGRFIISEYKNKNNYNIYKNILIPAGAGFGTGHHPTTKGIILLLNKIFYNRIKPHDIIDIGSGSGILGIIMARLWKSNIECIDIDKHAIKASILNVKNNNVQNFVKVKQGYFPNISSKYKYDLIIINILALPIMSMSKAIRSKLKKTGKVLLSGILSSQMFMICNKFRKLGLIMEKHHSINNWSIILLKIKIPPTF